MEYSQVGINVLHRVWIGFAITIVFQAGWITSKKNSCRREIQISMDMGLEVWAVANANEASLPAPSPTDVVIV